MSASATIDGQTGRNGFATAGLLTAAVSVLALPSAVLAFSSRFVATPVLVDTADPLDSFRSADDRSLISAVMPPRSLAGGRPFRFTPAGTPTRPDRSVTVAVRVDPQTAQTITVRAARLQAPIPIDVPSPTAVNIAPTAFSLGVSRGYKSFSQTIVAPVEIRRIEMPDLASYKAGRGTRAAASRFTPRIQLDDKPAVGRSPRTFSGDNEDLVDVGGALRVTRNLDVTAGVRYSQDRERLQPVTDGKQDSQAVYVGTQFSF